MKEDMQQTVVLTHSQTLLSLPDVTPESAPGILQITPVFQPLPDRITTAVPDHSTTEALNQREIRGQQGLKILALTTATTTTASDQDIP